MTTTIIPQRRFHAINADVGVMGLGTVKFGRNTGVKYPGGDGFTLPDDAEISAILDLCLDHGVNLLDTAPAYGIAEARLGQIMGARRQKFILMSKTGEEFDGAQSTYIFTRAHTVASIERSLKRLSTDYLDCVLVHSSRNDVDVMKNTDVIETLRDLKAQGKIRSFGVSTYTVAGGLLSFDLSDAVMCAYNEGYTDEEPVIAAAATHPARPAVFVKKALSSGHAVDTARALRFACRPPAVTSVVVGSRSRVNILSNIKALSKG